MGGMPGGHDSFGSFFSGGGAQKTPSGGSNKPGVFKFN